MDEGVLSRTVSATEMVSTRAQRSSKTSLIRGRRLAGGNSLMMWFVFLGGRGGLAVVDGRSRNGDVT